MRYLRGTVAISLVLNLLLGIAFWVGPGRVPRRVEPVVTESAVGLPGQVVESTVTNRVTKDAPPKRLDWRTIESEDYKKYITNLRAVGCPEKTIRDVIIADVNDLFRERYRQIFPATNQVEYWKPGNPMADLFDETKIAKEHELAQEKRELVRTLLGKDYTDEQDLSAIYLDSISERTLGFLTSGKRTAMKELEDRFAVKMMKTYKDTWRGNDGPAEAVQAQKDEAMLEILSSEEKFEYDLRRSDTAMLLRVGLGHFEVSETEFRAIFPGIKDFIQAAGKPGFGATLRGQPDPRPEGGAARAELRARLKAALGEERLGQLIEQTGWNLKGEEQP